MINLIEYQTHNSVEELKSTEKAQLIKHRLKNNDMKVYCCIVKHSLGNKGACKLKSQTIADELGISRSTVTRVLKRLKDLRLIDSHEDTKMNGIKGANIYSIIFLSQGEPSSEPTIMSQRVTHETPTGSRFEHTKKETESLSFNLSFNPFVIKNVVNNVAAASSDDDLNSLLRNIYNPQNIEQERDFKELARIAFGRLKQFMKLYNIPYLQMKHIVLNCMNQLVKKTDVRNIFAMYSKMIERQVKQLFEEWKKPVKNDSDSLQSKSKEFIPEWFNNRGKNDYESLPSTEIDFEAERLKVLAKLGGN